MKNLFSIFFKRVTTFIVMFVPIAFITNSCGTVSEEDNAAMIMGQLKVMEFKKSHHHKRKHVPKRVENMLICSFEGESDQAGIGIAGCEFHHKSGQHLSFGNQSMSYTVMLQSGSTILQAQMKAPEGLNFIEFEVPHSFYGKEVLVNITILHHGKKILNLKPEKLNELPIEPPPPPPPPPNDEPPSK